MPSKATTIRGVPYVVPIILGLLVIGTYVLNRTRYGRHVYAVGGNRQFAGAEIEPAPLGQFDDEFTDQRRQHPVRPDPADKAVGRHAPARDHDLDRAGPPVWREMVSRFDVAAGTMTRVTNTPASRTPTTPSASGR